MKTISCREGKLLNSPFSDPQAKLNISVVFQTLQEFYTDNPKTFEDYGRIINQRHFKRVMSLMDGSTVAVGGDSDESQCYIGICCVVAAGHLKVMIHRGKL